MLREISREDFEVLSTIVRDTVRFSVASNEEEAEFLIDDIEASLGDWFSSGANGFSNGFDVAGHLAGFIVIKDYWNLSHLFVSPKSQRRGIGSALLCSALEPCKALSPRNRIQLNSSDNAAGFYEASGFVRAGPGIDRAGGCIPYEIVF